MNCVEGLHAQREYLISRSIITQYSYSIPDSKVPGANMGPIWGQQDPDGSHVGPRNFAIWDDNEKFGI